MKATSPTNPTGSLRSAHSGYLHRAPLVDGSGWPMHRVAFTRAAAEAIANGEKLPGYVPNPWLVAQLRELLGVGANRHTITRVRAMGTEDILAKLARVDARVSAESFVAEAEEHDSAWELSEAWAEESSVADPEFLGLAACELWRRLLPGRPSVEMLDEQMQEGYDASDAGDGVGACRIWLRLWDALLHGLPEDVRTLEEAKAWLPGLNSLGNWSGDFGVELHNAALRDRGLARQGLALYERVAERLESSPALVPLQRQLAELLYWCDQPEHGEAVLRSVIEQQPDDAGAYVLLAEKLAASGRSDRAMSVLEGALALPVKSPESWSLHERLDELRVHDDDYDYYDDYDPFEHQERVDEIDATQVGRRSASSSPRPRASGEASASPRARGAATGG